MYLEQQLFDSDLNFYAYLHVYFIPCEWKWNSSGL